MHRRAVFFLTLWTGAVILTGCSISSTPSQSEEQTMGEETIEALHVVDIEEVKEQRKVLEEKLMRYHEMVEERARELNVSG